MKNLLSVMPLILPERWKLNHKVVGKVVIEKGNSENMI